MTAGLFGGPFFLGACSNLRPPPMHSTMTDDDLATGLLEAVRAQDFGATADPLEGGRALRHFPSIDLALVVFPPGAPLRRANVLFSREHPRGVAAGIDGVAGRVNNIHQLCDERDAAGVSMLWQPGSDWSQQRFRTLAGTPGQTRFVSPYPASLLKLMVAVGIGMAVDAGRCVWPSDLAGPMITVSDNDTTTALVAQLHALDMMAPMNARLAALGLGTLQINGSTRQGGWGNAAGAGVGQIHMTAWDTVRLLWLLDEAAPPAPWLPAGTTLLQPATREKLRVLLDAQELNEILSSTSLTAVPGWVPGIPPTVAFAHKTGTTENYASDGGIARAAAPARRHYLVSVLSNLGSRYAPHADCATTWRLPALGAALDALAARACADPAA